MLCPNCTKEVVQDRLFCPWCETFIPNPQSGRKAGLLRRWLATVIDPVVAVMLYLIFTAFFSGLASGFGIGAGFGTIIIVTQGEKGSMAIDKGEEVWAQADPVPKEKIIDSVGSGDIFSAAFAYDHFLYKDLKKALDFANNIARQCLFFTPDEIKIKLD